MKLQTGLLQKLLWCMRILAGVVLVVPAPAWAQYSVPPGPGGSPNEYTLEDVEISLQRTACHGVCPVYELRIRGNGQVVYEGERHVRVAGRQEAIVDKAVVLDLLEKIYHARFFDMADGYYGQRNIREANGKIFVLGESRATDMASKIVTVRIGAYEKRVVDYLGSPADLVQLIPLIDEAGGVRQWVTCEGTPAGFCYGQ